MAIIHQRFKLESLTPQYKAIVLSCFLTFTTACFPKLASEDKRRLLSATITDATFLKGVPSSIIINKGTSTHEIDFELEAINPKLTYEVKENHLLKKSGLEIKGSEKVRKLKLTPEADQYGTADIVFFLESETSKYEQKLRLIVNAPPTIDQVSNQSSIAGQSVSPVLLNVSDPDSIDFEVFATSSDQTLIKDSSIKISQTSQGYTLSYSAEGTAVGSSIIQIHVTDGTAKTTSSFLHTITSGLTLGNISNSQINQDSQLAPVSFSVSDSAATITATSSNTTLVPNANITLTGTGATRSIQVLPAAGQYGSTTITLSATTGNLSASTSFTLTVNALPSIASISSQSIIGGATLSNLAITLSDSDSSTLTLTATSSNTTLVPNANLTLGGTGTSRTLSIAPANNQYGNSIITLTVSDAYATVTRSFLVSVTGGPSIGTIANQTLAQNTSSSALSFTVSDPTMNSNNLYLTASSSNTTLIPNNTIVFGGSAGNRTVTVTPANNQYGSATITLTVNNGSESATTAFTTNVHAAPTITTIANQTSAGSAVSNIAFTVGDADTSLASLTISATSSNQTVLPNANIALGGSDANRTITVTPAASSSGTATVTVNVSDGTNSISTSFTLSVSGPPSIASISNQTWNQDASSSSISITVSDPSVAVGSLTLSGTSSDTTLIPNSGLAFSGTGGTRQLVITPASGQYGSSTITLTVNNGSSSGTQTFTATVNAKPVVANISNQTTIGTNSIGPVNFNISDADHSASDLTVTATSNNTSLIPNENISLAGSGSTRSISITAANGEYGTATITVYANDGAISGHTTFTVTVYRPATALSFSGAGYAFPGVCSAIEIKALNSVSTESIVASAVTINLTQSGSLTFYSNSNCTTSINSTTLASGSSSKTIYFKNSTLETLTLTASDASATLSSANYSLTIQQTLPSNLVAYYRFNEASWSNNVTADIQDSSGNGYHALAIGANMASAGTGPDGSGSAYFNGTNYIQTDTTTFPISGTSARTVAFWGKISSAQTGDIGMFRMGSWTASPNYQAFGFNYNRNNHTTYLSSHTNFSQMGVSEYDITTQWVHFSVVYYGSASAATAGFAAVYMNGVLMSIGSLNVNSAANRLLIGYGSHTYRFNGNIDDFMVYDRALAFDEIQQLQSLAPPSKLAFVRTPSYMHAGTCDPVSIANVDINGKQTPSFASRTVNISGLSDAAIYSDAGCQNLISPSNVTIAAGSSLSKFYIKNNTPENITLTATDSNGKVASTSASLEFKAPLPSGLVGYYRFEDLIMGQQDGHDSSGNASNYPIRYTTGVLPSQSNSPDGTQSVYFYDNYAYTTSNFPISENMGYTVSFWAKLIPSDHSGLFSFGAGCTTSNCRSSFYFNKDQSTFYLNNYSANLTFYNTDTSNWQLYTIVKQNDQNNTTFYVNGEFVTYSTFAANITAAPLHIGYAHVNAGDTRGWMDEFMVFNRTLSQAEIKSLYKKTPPTKLTWSNAQATSHAGTCEKFVLSSQASDGKLANVYTDKTINLTGYSNGFFYTTSNCSDAGKLTTHSFTLAQGTSEKILYYKNATIESVSLVATDATGSMTTATTNHSIIIPLPTGLVGYYRFNEYFPSGATGDIHDSSANATVYPMTLSTGVRFNQQSGGPDESPSAYFFDSYAASVSNFPISGTGGYSVSFWAKLILSDHSGLFSLGAGCTSANCRSSFYYNKDNNYFWLNNYTSNLTLYNTETSNWQHYTIVKQNDQHNTTFYVNGEYAGYSIMTSNITAAPLHIGYAHVQGDTRGWMDEFMLFNRALSPSEAKALYKKASPTKLSWTNIQNYSHAGTCEKMELHSLASDNKIAAVHTNKTINLSGYSNGFFYTASNCSDASKISSHSFTLSAGESVKTLYYKNSTVESVTLTATDASSSMTTASASHQSILPLPTGLVGYYRFNEKHPTGMTAQIHDASGGAVVNPGGFSTGVSYAEGNSGADSSNSVYFFDSYAATGPDFPISGSGGYSVSFWAKLILSDHSGLFSLGAGCTAANCRSSLYYNKDQSIFYLNNYSANLTLSYTGTNEWRHYSIVKQNDSNNVTVYIDGDFAGYSTLAANITSAPLHIGYAHVQGDTRGWIDEFMVFNRTLSPSEAKALFKKASPTQLAIIDVTASHSADTCERVVIQTRAADGKLAAVSSNTTITISGQASGYFYSDITCTDSNQRLTASGTDQIFTLNAGQSEKIIYYRNANGNELMTWTVSGGGLTSATQNVSTLAPVPANLISYLRLNENEMTGITGELHDSSGAATNLPFSVTNSLYRFNSSFDTNGNNSIYQQKDITGKTNPLYFYGYNDPYIYSVSTTFPTTGTSARTFAFWVKQIDANSTHHSGYFRVGSGSGSGAFTSFWYNRDSNLHYLFDHSASNPSYSSVIGYGAWKHVVLTKPAASNVYSIYIDGVYNGSITSTTNTGAAGRMYWGYGNTYTLRGWMDELMVFSRDLTSSEVSELYNRWPVSNN